MADVDRLRDRLTQLRGEPESEPEPVEEEPRWDLATARQILIPYLDSGDLETVLEALVEEAVPVEPTVESGRVDGPRWDEDPVVKLNGWDSPERCGNCGEANEKIRAAMIRAADRAIAEDRRHAQQLLREQARRYDKLADKVQRDGGPDVARQNALAAARAMSFASSIVDKGEVPVPGSPSNDALRR